METIKITRIGGEFLNSKKEVSRYINPYTGCDFGTWFEFERGKKIFESLDFESLLKSEDEYLEEHKNSKEDIELDIILNFDEGFKPFAYLFSFEIPLDIWNKKEDLAKNNGYEDDFFQFITDQTNYSWNLELEKEILIPKEIKSKYKLA